MKKKLHFKNKNRATRRLQRVRYRRPLSIQMRAYKAYRKKKPASRIKLFLEKKLTIAFLITNKYFWGPKAKTNNRLASFLKTWLLHLYGFITVKKQQGIFELTTVIRMLRKIVLQTFNSSYYKHPIIIAGPLIASKLLWG